MSAVSRIVRGAPSVVRDPARLITLAADRAGRMIERGFIPIDQRLMRRNRNLATMPWRKDRFGGKVSYGEWAWVIGLMQGMIANQVPDRDDLVIVDVGCGSGLVSMAALPLLGTNGRCIGLDVSQASIDFCQKQHTDPRLSFSVLRGHNSVYAPDGDRHAAIEWPVDDGAADLVTALSVWTHLLPDDAAAAIAEVQRVLRPGGRAIISFFVAPDRNGEALPLPPVSAYHRGAPEEWVFDVPLAPGWATTSWARHPEQAISVDEPTLHRLVGQAGLMLDRLMQGTWSERPGAYFQDFAIISKPD